MTAAIKTLAYRIKPNWPIALFIGLHIIIIMLVFNGAFPDEEKIDGRSLYYFYAERVFDSNMPYQDFDIEYAPLALPIFLIPRLFVQSDLSYHIAFTIQILFWDILGLLTIFGLSKRMAFPQPNNFLEKLTCQPWGVLTIYTILLMGMGPLIIDKFDLVVAVMVLFALYALIRGWNTISWMALALGAMTKIFPVILIPIFALYLYRNEKYRDIVKGMLVFGATVFIVAAPFIWICPGEFLDSFTYHSERELQIESTYASVLLLGDAWNITSAGIGFGHGSYYLDSSLADTFARLSPLFTACTLAMVFYTYTGKLLKTGSSDKQAQNHLLVNFSLLTIIAFMLVNKVFSPQYIFWLYPLIPLVIGKWRLVILALFLMIGPLTRYIYPWHYFDLVQDKDDIMIYILVLRNSLLLLMAALLLKWNPPITKNTISNDA